MSASAGVVVTTKPEKKKPVKWVSYGYFVKLPNGHLVPAGHDFGPTKNSYKIGDTKVGRPGKVIHIFKGATAKKLGFDVVIIAETGEGSSP
jgi:hypothetical protein